VSKKYIFKSERLGFREWSMNDLLEFSALNGDEDVMEHFPNVLSQKETEDFIIRLQKHLNDYGLCYYATEVLQTEEFIGFIGLAYQAYAVEFLPATDIGWRLKKSAWGKGYATEGAKRCLEYGFNELNLEKIVATCTLNNAKSERVMKKIGMTRQGEFLHPKLKEYPEYEWCIWYQIDKK
jgi:RimJ/RimL family protein N-acetyltransferase